MRTTRHLAVRRSRRATSRITALAVTQAVLLLPLAVGPLTPAQAASVPATPVSAGCGLTLLARNQTGPRSDLVVAVPEQLSRATLPASAFMLRQAARDVPVTLRPRAAAEQAVAVVLASSARTPGGEYDVARGAALELLVGLRPGTRTAVGSTGPTALAPLSPDRQRTTSSLRLSRAGAGTTAAAAVERTAQDLPNGGDVVLFSDGSHEGTQRQVQALVRRLRGRDIVVTRVGYAGTSSAEVTGRWSSSASQRACDTATAALPVLRQSDLVQALIRGQYRISGRWDATKPAVLSVRSGSATSRVQVPAAATTALPDPYRDNSPSRPVTLLLYGLAGELTLLGLVLLVGPRRRNRLVGRPLRGAGAPDRSTAPGRSLSDDDRVGAQAGS